MKVYILTATVDYEGTDIVGVYASKESADAGVLEQEKRKKAIVKWLNGPPGKPCPEYADGRYSVNEHEVIP